MNWKLNSHNVIYKVLLKKELQNTPINTIMPINPVRYLIALDGKGVVGKDN